MAKIPHLTRRFFGSLRPGGPGPENERWVQSVLSGAEHHLWRQLSGPDRRHSVGVARAVKARLGERATQAVLAAALLHDVGKLRSGLRTPGRVLATVVAGIGGRERISQWSAQRGYRQRIGLYLGHPEIGAAMLRAVGSDPVVVQWAAQHHRPAADWTIDRQVAAVLNEVDDD